MLLRSRCSQTTLLLLLLDLPMRFQTVLLHSRSPIDFHSRRSRTVLHHLLVVVVVVVVVEASRRCFDSPKVSSRRRDFAFDSSQNSERQTSLLLLPLVSASPFFSLASFSRLFLCDVDRPRTEEKRRWSPSLLSRAKK